MVVVKRNKPLKAMKLIIFKLTSLEDGWLANDLLFNSVRQVIVDCV